MRQSCRIDLTEQAVSRTAKIIAVAVLVLATASVGYARQDWDPEQVLAARTHVGNSSGSNLRIFVAAIPENLQSQHVERRLKVVTEERDRLASSLEDFERDLQNMFKSEPTPPAPDPVTPSGTVCIVHDVRPPDDWLALRSEPSTRNGSQLRRLPSGTEFVMLGERQGDWYRVRTMDGEVGWVSWAIKRWIRC